MVSLVLICFSSRPLVGMVVVVVMAATRKVQQNPTKKKKFFENIEYRDLFCFFFFFFLFSLSISNPLESVLDVYPRCVYPRYIPRCALTSRYIYFSPITGSLTGYFFLEKFPCSQSDLLLLLLLLPLLLLLSLAQPI